MSMQLALNSFAELEPKIRASTSQEWHRLDLSLGRILTLLTLLGNPERELRGIHIAGTNGKGSTGAMLFSALAQAGQKVGFYSSPHLVSYAERFRVGMLGLTSFIEESRLYAYLEQIYLLIDLHFSKPLQPPTWFEIQTAVALCFFRDEKVDWVILEVGLGGRLDATNVKDWDYKVITDIDLDHTQVLGETVEEIAAEKAGILDHISIQDARSSMVTSATGAALEIIRESAAQHTVPITVVGEDIQVADIAMDWTGVSAEYRQMGSSALDGKYKTPLLGWHQAMNLGCVLATLMKMVSSNDLSITPDQIQAGLDKADWPGRMTLLGPMLWPEKKGKLILDGAHNPSGIKALISALKSLIDADNAGCLRVIFAAKQDKAVAEMLGLLGGIKNEFIMTQIHPSIPIADLTNESLSPAVFKAKTPKAALSYVRTHAKRGDYTIVCGSLYLLGEVLKILAPRPVWQIDEMTYNADARRSYRA